MPSRVTAEAVDEACEEIKGRGETPTNESVRAYIGGGSFGAISPLVKAWKKADKAWYAREEANRRREAEDRAMSDDSDERNEPDVIDMPARNAEGTNPQAQLVELFRRIVQGQQRQAVLLESILNVLVSRQSEDMVV